MPQNKISQFIKNTEKEFEKKLNHPLHKYIGSFSRTSLSKLFEEYQLGLKDLIVSLIPEEGIQWMQEGNHKDKKGFTEGFNFAREQFLKNLEK